ncbi:ABC transporter ATP-binding protein [Clostridium sp. LIBA-8841]|uniref:ABC transporter ATP-binding protein n=1 Tax=Clostridium sp. LIBA-8841 TaxID=2987530 RepID=UPI002AC440C3|nr:ABC transporter ATP-binding protein [Clostridium sp. LIBA-8841]MDZ5253739.1 ABC transporter ATP-binding protein [Clostridium sp. LIBA-8841]
MSAIIVEGVTKNFGNINILNKISIKIEKGEILCLVGPSGAGKTTLVKSIIGMEKVNSGSIKVLDEKMPNRKVLQKIGYMAQSDALYEDLSALDNLTFFSSLYSLSKEVREKNINYLLDLVNLTDHKKKRVKNFSGGMKRRLSLASALIQDPEILILDEPTVGIDPELRLSIWEELHKLKKNNKAIIVTTHVMDEAERCDRVVFLRDGKIIEEGSPVNLKEKYNASSIEEVFLKARRDK